MLPTPRSPLPAPTPGSALRPTRVLFITNIPSPYQVDFFTALSERPEVEIDVLFCAANEHDRQFTVPPHMSFNATILDSHRLPGTPKDWHRVPRLDCVLQDHMPFDLAVLSGSYSMPAVRTARRFMICHRIPWYYWGENPRKKPGAAWRSWLREAYLRRFLAPASGVFGVGLRACDTYRSLVSDGTPVHNLPYAPNLDPLLNPSEETRLAAARLCAGWPADAPVVVLFSGSLTPRKAPETLLAAFAQVAARHRNLCLQFVGDGPLRTMLEKEVRALGLSDRVRFLGFLEGPALHAAYLSSDLFVLPTRTHEGWGVVVQEALGAGLPVIASDCVGAASDLVLAGKNGWLFSSASVDDLATLLGTAISAETRCAHRCRESVLQSSDRHAANLIAMILGITQGPTRSSIPANVSA